MKTASLFKNGRNQAVQLPKDFEFEVISEVEITGNALALDCILVTNETHEFERVENLQLEDWSILK